MIDLAITLLKGTPSVVSITTQKRIYPYIAPQATTQPYIVVNRSGRRDEEMVDGDGGYPEIRVRISCVAATATVADALGDATIDALSDQTKLTVGEYVDVDTRLAGLDFSDYDEESKLCVRTLDFYLRGRKS